MYQLYSLLLTIGFILYFPKFAIDAVRNRKYITGLRERLGRLPVIASTNPIIWLHCVSVGETEAARPLVNALRNRFPSHQLVVSTTTVTGQRVARAAFGREAAAIVYFPIDWTWCVRRVLDAYQPAAVLIMETELWPNFLRECGRRSIPVGIVNGRISLKSFRRYKLVRLFMSRVLNSLSVAVMQSAADAERIQELGLAEQRIVVSGNLKFDSADVAIDPAAATEIRERFGLNDNVALIVAASTHAPEESLLIAAFKQIRNSPEGRASRLLIAPRHPERFNQVAALLQNSGLSWRRRSAPQSEADRDCDVILLDSIGELRTIYSLATLAFVGGSIAPHGGHNVLEPVAYRVCVITGPHTQNFTAITSALAAEEALVQLPFASETEVVTQVASALKSLLADDLRRKEIVQRALAVCNLNRGATERTLEIVARLLAVPAPVGKAQTFSSIQLTATK